MELLNKIEKEGGYQDVEIDGKLIFNGWRECQERWNLIKPKIKEGNVVMDIGSHYGYFDVKIARTIPKSIVWSIESDKTRADIQKDVLALNKLKNVILCCYKIKLLDFVKLSRVVEGIDIIMALSVFHYFEPDELTEIIGLCSRIAPKLIIEFPNPDENNVASKDNVDKLPNPIELLNGFYEIVETLGKTSSPSDKGIERTIYFAENKEIEKVHLNSYFGRQTIRKYKLFYKNEHWEFQNKDWINGLNVRNLLEFNVIYPSMDYILDQASETYLNLIKRMGAVSDTKYRNLIWSYDGFKAIDFSEGLNNDIYGVSWQEYKEKIEKMTKQDFIEYFKVYGLI